MKKLSEHYNLHLVKYKNGYSYQWEGGHGEIVCCGWAAGTEREVKEEATNHINGK